jgi:hypothetical protein
MLPSEVARVQERSRLFRKRTSFEDSLLNEHIQAMLKALQSTEVVTNGPLPANDKPFEAIRESKQLDLLSSNYYLTEEEKWEITECTLGNQ